MPWVSYPLHLEYLGFKIKLEGNGDLMSSCPSCRLTTVLFTIFQSFWQDMIGVIGSIEPYRGYMFNREN
jgi:hypothetical protein